MRRALRFDVPVLLLSLIPSTSFAPYHDSPATSLAPVELVADGFRRPTGVAVDQAGAIFVSEERAGRITRLAPDGTRTIISAGFDHPIGLAVDPQGRLLIVEQGRGRLWRLEPTGSRTLLASGIKDPRWVAVAQDGTVYITARATSPQRALSATVAIIRTTARVGALGTMTTPTRAM